MRAPTRRVRTKGPGRPFSRTNWKLESNWPGESGQPETPPATCRSPRATYGLGEAIELSARRAWSFGAIPVVLNQHIFESRFFHREVGHGKSHEKRRQRAELPQHTKNPSAGFRIYHLVTLRQGSRNRNILLECDAHAPGCELPRVFDGGEQDDLAFAQHRDAVANPLHFGQHVRRHENGTPTIARIGQQFIERFLHEGIETFRGFVQDQQERVGLKRLYQAELSFHASAVLAQLSREIAIA